MSEAPGAFDDYRVLGLLGTGATARVYRVADPGGGPDLAVKLLHAEVAATEEARRRFHHEVELARGLDSEAIPAVAAQGELDGVPWVAMELVEGKTLEQRLDEGVLPWREALGLVVGLVDALGRLHEAGIVHRDVKPANVVLEASGRIRLVDLGLATTLLPDGRATSAGSRAGTPRYMSPEQVLGRSVLPASDLYAVGICLFEALTGESPYPATNEAALLAAHAHGRPDTLPPEAGPAALEVVLAGCLSKSPEQRHASASELAADLRLVLEDADVEPAATIAGRRLGLRRLRGALPGRARELALLRRWLKSVAAGRSVPKVVLVGPPGSGRSALLEWAAAEAVELGLAVSDGVEAELRILDDAASLPEGAGGGALLLACGPSLGLRERKDLKLVELEPLGSGAIRRWVKDELGLKRVDARDLEFIERWSGGWPGRLEPLLFRWQSSLHQGNAPEPGRLASLLEADDAERARTGRLLEALDEETRLLVELLACLHPARVEAESVAAAVGLEEDALDRALGSAMRAGLPIAFQGDVLGLRDPVVARVVAEGTDPELAGDLAEEALELLESREDGTARRRCAELLLEAGREADAGDAAVQALRQLRREGRGEEATRFTEDWVERIDWPRVERAAELIRQALRYLGESGEDERARTLLDAASPRMDASGRLALRFEEAAAHWRRGDLGAALQGYLALAADSRRLGDHGNRFRALNGLASIDWARGRQARAARHFALLESLSREVEPSERVDWLRTRGAVALLMGEEATAESCLGEAWGEAQESGGEEALLFLAEERAALLLRQDRTGEARDLLGEAVALAHEVGNKQRVAYLTHLLGNVFLQRGEVPAAARTLRAARRAAFKTGHSYLIACNEELLARVAAAAGDLDEARRRIRLTRHHDPGVPNVEAYLRLAEMDLALLEGDPAAAAERLAAADELLDSIDDEGLLYRRVLLWLLQAASAEGDAAEARDGLDEPAVELARTSFAFRIDEFRRRSDLPSAEPG